MSNAQALAAGLTVRNGDLSDLSDIIRIVNSKNNRLSFGWVQKVVLADAADDQKAKPETSQHRLRVVVDSAGNIVAFLRAYLRRDGVVTLHEIGVAEANQSSGIGAYLVNETIAHSRARGMMTLRVKTPVGMRSNGYYPRFGFRLVGSDAGRKRGLNVYELPL
jgi:N-acetylglutamate synthase-like GNAT family acetyltransferase